MKSPIWAAQNKQRGSQFDMPDISSALKGLKILDKFLTHL